MGVRIGGASAFYGDSQLAARQLVDAGDLDYLVFDYLAEVTMAILAKAANRDPNLGFATDFVSITMADVLEDCAHKGIKVIANAGGVNVPSCMQALQTLAENKNLDIKIAGVYGDDLQPILENLPVESMLEMQSGAEFPKNTASANAYLGAMPIAQALAEGADIVVTGRVVDSAVTLAPLIHEFGWNAEDYDLLAQGALCGHVIECGAQCCGGNFTDWREVPDFSNISYPVADVSKDGSFTIEIPPETGGLVTFGTVAEQIVYEIGDPANYLLPDVACDFSHVKLEELEPNKVRVSGAQGRAPGNNYKVCATWVDGYRLTGSFYMAGPRSAAKARTGLEAMLRRTRRHFEANGLQDYRRTSLEIVGAEDIYGELSHGQNSREVMGKYALHHDQVEALKFAAMETAYLATSGPPAMSGFAAGRPRPQPLMRIHSCLLDKKHVPVTVQVGADASDVNIYETSSSTPVPKVDDSILPKANTDQPLRKVRLEELAWARSGDKGDNANVGVIARREEYLPYISEQLTADAVASYFSHLLEGDVSRYYMPGINAFNFFMTKALGGGGTASLRLDAQAKTYAQMLLDYELEIPGLIFSDHQDGI